MKNITVSVDEETHRHARIRAAELGTSLSALVRSYLESLVLDSARGPGLNGSGEERSQEDEIERHRQLMNEVVEDIRATRSGFRAADNLPREELYNRARAREEAAVSEGREQTRG